MLKSIQINIPDIWSQKEAMAIIDFFFLVENALSEAFQEEIQQAINLELLALHDPLDDDIFDPLRNEEIPF